jgi:hypothetical protein
VPLPHELARLYDTPPSRVRHWRTRTLPRLQRGGVITFTAARLWAPRQRLAAV